MKTVLHGARLVAAAEIDTPIGPMTALATREGLAALWFDARERYADDIGNVPDDPGHPAIAAARRWLSVYWARGDAGEVEVPLDLHGTPFQRAVWAQLQRIPQGQTRSYGEVAAAVGGGAVARAAGASARAAGASARAAGASARAAGASARATGAACGANPVGVIVPCHRVIGANGSLTGFAGGLPRKTALLQHEGALLT
jgi:methylated-DNA-[protein]-cysteine S-methyltransferase